MKWICRYAVTKFFLALASMAVHAENCTVSGKPADCSRPVVGRWACQDVTPSSIIWTSSPQCTLANGACATEAEAFEQYKLNVETAWASWAVPVYACKAWGKSGIRDYQAGWFLGEQTAESYWFDALYGSKTEASSVCSEGTMPVLAQCQRPAVCPPGYFQSSGSIPSSCVSRKSEACPVGNPIQCGTGEKFHKEADYASVDASPIEFYRYYSSSGFYSIASESRSSSSLGLTWRHSYQQRLLFESDDAGGSIYRITVVRPDGDYRQFSRNAMMWQGRKDKTEALQDLIVDGHLVGWKFVTADDAVELYDLSGSIQSLHLKSGRSVKMTYSNSATPPEQAPQSGLLLSVTDDKGRSLRFSYDQLGRLVFLHGPDGGVYSYVFSGNDLVKVLNPSGSFVGYIYNESGLVSSTKFPLPLLTGIEDESGNRFATYRYDNHGRATSEWHGPSTMKADELAITYNSTAMSDSFSNTMVDALGARRLKYFVAVNGILRDGGESQPSCGTPGCNPTNIRTIQTYDGNGNRDKFTDRRGIVVDFDFNERGLESQRVQVANSSCPAALPNCLQAKRKIQTDWHGAFRVPTERRTYNRTNVLEQVIRFAYNARGQQTARCQVEPADASAISYVCGTQANAPVGVRQIRSDYCEETDLDFGSAACPRVGLLRLVDGPRTDVSDVTTFTYRAADEAACATQPTTCAYRKGDLWKTTNALGQVSEVLAYDGAGRVLSVFDANGVRTDFEYTARGWLSRRLVRGADDGSESDDQIITFGYEAYGSINKVTQPDGSFLRYHYDAAHRLVGISDAAGDRIDYTLDAAGNRVKEESKDPDGNVMRLLARQFDTLNRMRSQVNAPFAAAANLDDPSVKKARFQYDANGNTDQAIDALDVVTDNDYDALNRLVRTIGDYGVGNLNASSQFTYDARDNLRSVTDPKGLVTNYTYDGLDNLTQLQSPDTGVTTYTHDAAGNRVTQTDARGVTSTYAYDALNRLTGIGFPDSTKDLGFVYDAPAATCAIGERYSVGRLSRFTDETGSTEFCYDRRGQLVRRTAIVDGDVQETVWIRDAAGRIASLTYPSGTVVAYERDSSGRVVGVGVTPPNAPTKTLISDVAYLPFGPVGTIIWGDQSALARRYDQNYWIDQIESSRPEGLVLDFTEDLVGNIVALSDTLAPTTPVDQYGYDDLYRLTDVNSAVAGQTSYGYDATGNRMLESGATGTTVYDYPLDSHRLTDVGGTQRGFDATGNLTVLNLFNRSSPTYVYDDRNRLTSYTVAGREVTIYGFNARGERVLRHFNDRGVISTTRYVYDEAGRLLSELAPKKESQVATDIVWLDDLPVGLIDPNGEVRPIEPDHLGSPRKVIDASRGVAVWEWPILGHAFGTAAANDDPDGDGIATTLDLRFPGQQYDAATGLHYNYFRDYDPATGRYVESDPIGLRGGVSTFQYAAAGPVDHSDPSGLFLNPGGGVGITCGPWGPNGQVNCGGSFVAASPPRDIPMTNGSAGFQGTMMAGYLGASVGAGGAADACGTACWYIKVCGLVGEGAYIGASPEINLGGGSYSSGYSVNGGLSWAGGVGVGAGGDIEIGDGFNTSMGVPIPHLPKISPRIQPGVGEYIAGKGCLVLTMCDDD